MNKILKSINLIEKYRKLNTKNEKKQFILMWSTIFTCFFTVAFICSSIFYSINKNSAPEEKLNQYKEPAQESITQDLNSNSHKSQADNTNVKPNDVSIETNKIEINKVSDSTEKGNIKINKPIYAGARTTHAAITFDDGYNKKYVEKVLDVLKKNNVKATFFIIGKVLDDYPEVWKRAIKEGHQICNHTQSHQILTKLSEDAIQKEILGWEASARKVFGDEYLVKMKKEFPYLRLPGGGGARSDKVLAIAQENGYKVIGWNLETFSSIINPLKNKKSVSQISDRIEQHVVNNCSGGSIVLLHFNQYDMGNIEQIVSGLKNRGFELKTISQMIK